MNLDVIFSWIIIIAPIVVVLGIISWLSYRSDEVDRYTRRNLGGRITIPKTREIMEELIADALANPHKETKSRSSRGRPDGMSNTPPAFMGELETDAFIGEIMEKFFASHHIGLRITASVWYDPKLRLTRCRVEEVETSDKNWTPPNWPKDIICTCCPDRIIMAEKDPVNALQRLATLPVASYIGFEDLITSFVESVSRDILYASSREHIRFVKDKIRQCDEDRDKIKKWYQFSI